MGKQLSPAAEEGPVLASQFCSALRRLVWAGGGEPSCSVCAAGTPRCVLQASEPFAFFVSPKTQWVLKAALNLLGTRKRASQLGFLYVLRRLLRNRLRGG